MIKNSLKFVFVFFNIYLMSLAGPAAGRTDVISVDWKTLGDGLLSRDLDNNLEWLDLRQTMNGNSNRTYDDVSSQLGIGGEFEGFRYASEAEIIELWTSAGIPDIDAGGTMPNFAPVSSLVALMNNTSPNPSLTTFTFGILGDSNSAGTHQSAMIDLTSPSTGRARPFVQDVVDSATNISGGHYLVRPVPEPSGHLLLLLGSLVAVFCTRTRPRH